MSFPGAGGAGAAGQGSQLDQNDPNVKKLNALMESCFAKTAMSGVAGFGLGALFGMFMASMAYDTPFHTPTPESTPAAKPPVAATGTAATAASASASASATKPPTIPTTPATAPASGAGLRPPVVPSPIAAAATRAAAAAGAAAAPHPTPPPLPLASVTAVGAAASAASASVPLTSLPLRRQLAVGFREMGTRSYSTARNFAKVGALFSGIECGIEGLRAKNDAANGVASGCITGALLARGGGPQAAAIGCLGFAAFSAAIEAYLRQPKDE